MSKHKLLAIEVWNSKNQGKPVIHYALGQLMLAIEHVETALCNPKSPERQAMDYSGFGAIILVGDGERWVMAFQKGHKLSVSANGLDVVKEEERTRQNLHEMLGWLITVRAYMEWCLETEEADKHREAPPVFDTASYGHVDEEVRCWCGVQAEAYLQVWKERRRALHAERAKALPVDVETPVSG